MFFDALSGSWLEWDAKLGPFVQELVMVTWTRVPNEAIWARSWQGLKQSFQF